MKTASAKAKGRVCCSETKDLLMKYAPDLRPGDIEITSSGATGEDIKLSPAARELYDFVIECKNTESINIWAAYKQAQEHKISLLKKNQVTFNTAPLVFYRRNRSKLMVTLEAEDFVRMIR